MIQPAIDIKAKKYSECQGLVDAHELKMLVSMSLPEGWYRVCSSRYAWVAARQAQPKVFFKYFLPRGPFEWFKALFRGSRSKRFVRGTNMVLSAGLSAPEVVCWDKSPLMAMLGRGWVITRAVTNCRGVLDLWKQRYHSASRPRQKDFLRCVASAVAKLHQVGICHGDLRPNNLLMEGDCLEGRFYFIDNERNTRYKAIPIELRVKNLVQLHRDLAKEMDRRLRFYFFIYYCNYCLLDREVRARLLLLVKERTEHVLGEPIGHWC